EDGEPQDLTIRSFGILKATEMPPVEVVIEPGNDSAVNGSDAVFAAVAAAAWIAQGCPPDWPTRRGSERGAGSWGGRRRSSEQATGSSCRVRWARSKGS